MKHLFFLLTLMSIASFSFSQETKKDNIFKGSEKAVGVAPKMVAVPHQYFLMLTDTTAQTIFALVKTSRKLSDDDKDSFLKLLNENIHPVTIPDTAATKRK